MQETMTELRLAEAEAAARSIRSDLDRALGYGVPPRELPGVGDYLTERLAILSALRFFLVVDASGQPLYQAGIDPPTLAALLPRLPPPARDNPTPAEGLAHLVLPPFILVSAPLENDQGLVLVAVEPGEIIEILLREITRTWPFWLSALLLALAWGWVSVRGAVLEPLTRLARGMSARGEAPFARLLVRRNRDRIGQCLLTFNAIVAGLHARRQAFIAQADDVHQAVFDPRMAEEVLRVKETTLQDLGTAMAEPPLRLVDPRASDGDLFALTLAAAAALRAASLVMTDPLVPTTWVLALIALSVGLVLGGALGWNKRLAILISCLLLAATLWDGWSPPSVASHLDMAVAMGTLALSWGMAWRQRWLTGRLGGLGGGFWVLPAASISGLSLAWGLQDASLMAHVGVVLLLGIALATALMSPATR